MHHVKHLLTIFDLSREDIYWILKRGAQFKDMLKQGMSHQTLEGKSIAVIFEKPSTRTRLSFEVGIWQLGAQPLIIDARQTQLSRGEALEDTARVFSRYVDAIVMRTFEQEKLETLARWSDVPVINALSDKYHPCQVLSDLLTVKEELGEELHKLKIAWVGDGNNVAHSWIAASGVLGLNLTLACPEGYMPDPDIVKKARNMGGQITITTDPVEAVKGAHVINTDVWASMGQEKEAEERKKIFMPYQVNSDLVKHADSSAIFLHCLPAHKGEEVTEEVFESPMSRVFNQAENRLHVQKAILEFLILNI